MVLVWGLIGRPFGGSGKGLEICIKLASFDTDVSVGSEELLGVRKGLSWSFWPAIWPPIGAGNSVAAGVGTEVGCEWGAFWRVWEGSGDLYQSRRF